MTPRPEKIAIDIGGTKTKIAVRRGSELDVFFHAATPATPEEAVTRFAAAIEQSGHLPGGIGIGCPGPLAPGAGRILSPPNLPHWHDFPLAPALAQRLGVPVRLENDANLGALGEAVHGSGRGFDTVFYLTISTGIGAGIVIDGRIHAGMHDLAGEIWAMHPGHFGGGETGPNLTDIASGRGLERAVRARLRAGATSRLTATRLDTRQIMAALEAHDPVAVAAVDDAVRVLAASLAFTMHLLAPDVVVLAGGLCTNEDWLVGPIQRRVREMLGLPALQSIPIRRAALWDAAVLWGALELVNSKTGGADRPDRRQPFEPGDMT